MTTLPAPSSAWTRRGSMPAMRARPYRPSVVIPAWGPVRLIAGTPSPWRAIDRSVALWCSPVASRTSSSRGSGSSVMAAARPRSSSVVSPIAETTTTRSLPPARSRAIRRATRLMRSASATDEPPYFWTTRGLMGWDIERAFYRALPGDPADPAVGWHHGGHVFRPRQPAADRPDRRRSARRLVPRPDRGRREPLPRIPGARDRADWSGDRDPARCPRPPPVLRGARPAVRGGRDRRAGVRLLREDGGDRHAPRRLVRIPAARRRDDLAGHHERPPRRRGRDPRRWRPSRDSVHDRVLHGRPGGIRDPDARARAGRCDRLLWITDSPPREHPAHPRRDRPGDGGTRPRPVRGRRHGDPAGCDRDVRRRPD